MMDKSDCNYVLCKEKSCDRFVLRLLEHPLSIVHDMVLRNYGVISVAPRPEGGTCFTVVFPAFDMEADV